MKYRWLIVVAALCFAGLSQAAEERWRNSNGNYNGQSSFGDSWHPGTLFIPASAQYPVFLKAAHFGFVSGSLNVQAKIWSASGSTIGSVLASFTMPTYPWPVWTSVDLSSASLVFFLPPNGFFISTNNPSMGPLGSSFKGAGPPTYVGYHFLSNDDVTWSAHTSSDWAIECTVETNYATAVAPGSLGRVKALYR